MTSPSARPLDWNDQDTLAVNTIRMLSADMVQKANSGHPGMPMGFALPAHLLWTRFLVFNPDNPFWPGRDRFVLSCGHGSALLYSLLHLSGYDLTMDDLKQFRQWESKTPGHPEYGMTPGVETTTGPLGQGVGNAIGMAMAQRYIREQLEVDDTSDFDPLDSYIYVIASDGDLQEGVSGEASSLAGRQQLGRLVVLYDDNHISIDGNTDKAWVEDVPARYAAYGWHVNRVDGDDPEAIYNAIVEAREETGRPSLIAVRTHIGYGSPSKQDTPEVHGSPLGEEELAATKKALGWSYDPFTIPDEVYALYTQAAENGREAHESWLAGLEPWMKADGDRAYLYEQLVHGAVPEGALDELPSYETGKKVATRGAFGTALNFYAKKLPAILGGSADLAGSVKTMIKDAGDFLPGQPGGRNIYFGIREHGMGAVSNGMALYAGLRPYTGTFLMFSDYMRGSIRLAALMNLPVIFVFSHDSVGLGEDGPTHQPVEHYAALRSIPNLHVIRPGDAAETAYAFKMALERKQGPTTILTTRQGLPVLDRAKFAPVEKMERGGYVLADSEGTPEVIFIATGSELSLAVEAWKKLTGEGVKARVVSLPCWETFQEQNEEYRESVLPSEVKARVGVEIGVSLGWERWTGDKGTVVSLERFGASAPANVLFEEFGFTVERVVEAARNVMK